MAALVEEVPGIAATEENADVEAGAALEEVPGLKRPKHGGPWCRGGDGGEGRG